MANFSVHYNMAAGWNSNRRANIGTVSVSKHVAKRRQGSGSPSWWFLLFNGPFSFESL